MNKIDSFTLFKQNSYGEYKENQLISRVEKIISPYAGIHRNAILKTAKTMSIPTTLHIQEISQRDLINGLSKLNARLEVTPLNHEVFVVCQRPKTYPAYIYSIFCLLYAVFSYFFWRATLGYLRDEFNGDTPSSD